MSDQTLRVTPEPWHQRVVRSLLYGQNVDRAAKARARVGLAILAFSVVFAIIAARLQRIPVVVDGYVATSAAAIVAALRPDGVDHCLFAHRSAEPAHGALLERLGKAPLLDLGMRLGEASGAVVAAGVVKAAVAAHNGMATFAEAAVSGPA